MKFSLVYYGDPRLRKKCEPITEITPEIRSLAEEMIQSLETLAAIGLACPQIGHMIRMFVLRRYVIQPDERWELGEAKVYINPKILEHSKEMASEEEGCVSIPRLRGVVERPYSIKVEYTNLEGERVLEEVEGYNARVILHENDHINGVLFIDRMKEPQRKALEPKLREIKQKYANN